MMVFLVETLSSLAETKGFKSTLKEKQASIQAMKFYGRQSEGNAERILDGFKEFQEDDPEKEKTIWNKEDDPEKEKTIWNKERRSEKRKMIRRNGRQPGNEEFMYQFFVEDEQIANDLVIIEGSDVNHIRNVLRMKCGEKVRISSTSGRNFFGTIDRIAENVVEVCITEETALDTELPCRICLFQGLPKSDKMELIVQKAVELGAAEVIPVAMKNCVVKLDAKKAAAKTVRWQEIAKSAAKQSKRSRIPVVREPVNYREAVALAGDLDVVLLPYENERGMAATREVMERIAPGQSVGIFIGPEGGFDPSEIALAKEEGMHLVSLGKRILRTETAGLATLSILMYHIESVSEAEEERDQP